MICRNSSGKRPATACGKDQESPDGSIAEAQPLSEQEPAQAHEACGKGQFMNDKPSCAEGFHGADRDDCSDGKRQCYPCNLSLHVHKL